MADDPDDEYKVGYQRPPLEHRFKKNKSGNPAGRPPGAKNKLPKISLNPHVDAVLRAVEAIVPVREQGELLEMSVFEAALRQLGIKAARGEFRFIKLLLEVREAAEQARLREIGDHVRSVDVYKAQWGPIFERARRKGLPEPAQLPHPHHVNISPETGLVEITGPDTPELKTRWETLKRALRMSESLLRAAREELAKHPDDSLWKEIVKRHSRMFRRLQKEVPPGWNWREDIGAVADDLKLAS